MSHKATSWLAELTGLTASEFRVLFHLCDCHNPSKGCFPQQSYLIDKAEVSNGTLNNVLSSLEEKGFLRRVRRVDDASKRQLSTLYILGCDDEPSPGIGDGAVSKKRAEPSPIFDESRLQPTGDKPVIGTGKGTGKGAREVLCSLLSENVADDFVEHRKAIRKPLTQRAAELVVQKLAGCDDPDAVVNASIMNGWQGVFPERGGKAAASTSTNYDPQMDRWAYIAKHGTSEGWRSAS